MSAAAIRLACHLIQEHFGEIVEKVCRFLLENGSSQLRVVVKRINIQLSQVKKALCVLISHGIVAFESTKVGVVEYTANINHCLLLARYPRFIYSAKTLYGDAGELIVEELLRGGQMLMSMVVERVTERLRRAVEGSQKVEPSLARGKFIQLVEARFVQRVPDMPDPTKVEPSPSSDIPKDEAVLYKLPSFVHDIGTPRGKRKREDKDDEQGQKAKRSRTDSSGETEYYIDEDIFWQVNLDRFHQYLRDQEIVNAVSRSCDKLGSEIVRTMLRMSELTTDKLANATAPMSFHEILRALPGNLNLDRNSLEQYLKVLTEDQTRIVSKVAEAGGGMYIVDLKEGSVAVCLSCIQSVVQERFGSKSHRIFKLLVLKKYLEQRQIESFALIPAKEAKDLLYQMFAEGYVSVQELSKAPDHAPSRTYYPFFINLRQVAQKQQDRCFKSLANLIARRKYEMNENKRLLEKAQRVEVIANSFRSSGADESHIAEIEEMITPSEQELLKLNKARMAKLETSELQLDEMMFTLENFLIYQQSSISADNKKAKGTTTNR